MCSNNLTSIDLWTQIEKVSGGAAVATALAQSLVKKLSPDLEVVVKKKPVAPEATLVSNKNQSNLW